MHRYAVKIQTVTSASRYDINCRYKGHFRRWLDRHAASIPNHLLERARAMSHPLPSWHHSMHNAQCQELNSFRRYTILTIFIEIMTADFEALAGAHLDMINL
jgi:hypothetical protein